MVHKTHKTHHRAAKVPKEPKNFKRKQTATKISTRRGNTEEGG